MNTGICGISIIMILSLLASGTPAEELYEVEFSTYIGGTGYEHIRDICADKQGNVYITGGTTSSDYPTTSGAYQQTHGGMFDIFVTKFDPTGDIIWSTLVGGKDYDRAYAIEGDYSDWAVAKFSPTGALIASTLIGGSEGENPDGIYVDAAGNVYTSGYTRSTDFPVTVETNQVRDGQKGAVVKLSADFGQLLYSTYMNGSKRDDLRASFLGEDGNWYAGGESGSADWPTKDW